MLLQQNKTENLYELRIICFPGNFLTKTLSTENHKHKENDKNSSKMNKIRVQFLTKKIESVFLHLTEGTDII